MGGGYCIDEQYSGRGLPGCEIGLRVRCGDCGDLSPKPADREHHRDHEGRQFKREINRAQLARLDVSNEFSDESHGVKKCNCQAINTTEGRAPSQPTHALRLSDRG